MALSAVTRTPSPCRPYGPDVPATLRVPAAAGSTTVRSDHKNLCPNGPWLTWSAMDSAPRLVAVVSALLPLGHGPDPGDEHLDAQPVVEVRVAVGHRRGAFDQVRVPGRGQHRELELAAPVPFRALLVGELGLVAGLAHDQGDPGPQRAPGDLGGVDRIEPGATQDG